jgi:wyosine [tRNA(Phe)-imidazoG37] synthetase (radical SAM superfamily)
LQNVKTLVFGLVPLRCLGRSLGVNNILPKTCSYSCVYCQFGKTTYMLVDRQAFYKPEHVLMQVKRKISEAKLQVKG